MAPKQVGDGRLKPLPHPLSYFHKPDVRRRVPSLAMIHVMLLNAHVVVCCRCADAERNFAASWWILQFRLRYPRSNSRLTRKKFHRHADRTGHGVFRPIQLCACHPYSTLQVITVISIILVYLTIINYR